MAVRTPPRYVPTLTEVVGAAPAMPAAAAISQEQLVHRILQRIDLSLDRQLREAIASVVLEQTRSLGPLLREEIGSVVRQTVAHAFEEEMTASAKPTQPST